MKRPTPLKRYIAQNVYGRCGEAVTRLAAAGLVPRPALADTQARGVPLEHDPALATAATPRAPLPTAEW
ncbi:MAG TPA: hypothetical protein VM489_10960 [Burkholderiales bacterium]|nr:hypothetical protein [Burkholderiales bacterium]